MNRRTHKNMKLQRKISDRKEMVTLSNIHFQLYLFSIVILFLFHPRVFFNVCVTPVDQVF